MGESYILNVNMMARAKGRESVGFCIVQHKGDSSWVKHVADGRDKGERFEANIEHDIRLDQSSRSFRERIHSDPKPPHVHALAYSRAIVLTKERVSEMRLSRFAVLMDSELLKMNLPESRS